MASLPFVWYLIYTNHHKDYFQYTGDQADLKQWKVTISVVISDSIPLLKTPSLGELWNWELHTKSWIENNCHNHIWNSSLIVYISVKFNAGNWSPTLNWFSYHPKVTSNSFRSKLTYQNYSSPSFDTLHCQELWDRFHLSPTQTLYLFWFLSWKWMIQNWIE